MSGESSPRRSIRRRSPPPACRTRVTFDAVLETIRIAQAAALRQGLARPRIAVAGLNPHASEGGLFGDEEATVIAPAVAAARAEGIDASGPHAPDTVFMRARNAPDHPGEFDLVVAMTHDHGLIPVKYLGVERGVNVTLGLPILGVAAIQLSGQAASSYFWPAVLGLLVLVVAVVGFALIVAARDA